MPITHDVQTHIEDAERNFREKKRPETVAAIDKAVAAVMDTAAMKEELSAELLTRLVKVTRDCGEWSDYNREQLDPAGEVSSKALGWYPDYAGLLIQQGWLHYVDGHYDHALRSFEKALTQSTTDNDRLEALEGTGAALRERDQYIEAENRFARAVGPDGETTPGVLIERGWLRIYQRKWDIAFADFEKAINRGATDNNKDEAMSGQIAARLAHEAEKTGPVEASAGKLLQGWIDSREITTDEAVEIIKKAIDLHSLLNNYKAVLLGCDLLLLRAPGTIKFYEQKIEALKWLRRFNGAEKVFEEARTKPGQTMILWKAIANTYFQQKRFEKAFGIYSGEELDEPDPVKKAALIRELVDDQDAIEWTIVLLRQMGSLDEAESRVDLALERFPENIYLLSERAAIFIKKHEYQQAIGIFEGVLESDEYDEFAHQWLAAAFRKQGKFAEARKRIRHALDKNPTGSRLWEERAWLAFDQGKLTEADEYFAKAIQLDFYLIQRQFSRVEVLSQLGRTDDALEIFKELEQEFPRDAEVTEQLGWFYLRRGELGEAKKRFELIESWDQNSVLAINGLGGCYLEEREYVSAASAFRRAINLARYEPQYHINLAWALLRQVKEPGEVSETKGSSRKELLDQSIASCRNALEVDPYNAKAHLCLGVIAFKRNALIDAEAYFRKSIKLNPRDGGHVELGSLYVQMARYEEAKPQLEKAIQISPNEARAYVELANLYLLMEDASEAIRLCRRALAIDFNDDSAHRGLAIALMRAGQYEEAEKILRNAILRLSLHKRGQLQLLLSEILIRLGDDKNKDRDLYGEALKHINEAKRTNGSVNADIHFHAGVVHYKLEDYRSARKSFADCLKANHDRYEAERYEKLAKAMIRQERRISKINVWGGLSMAVFCTALLLALWFLYVRHWTRPLIGPAEAAQAIKHAREAKDAGLTIDTSQELIVDRSMLTFMTPLLLGLLIVGLLLPNLNKLKLPGGFEAEISELRTKESISSGPKGEIGFGSSLPIVSPGPGHRAR